MNINYNDLHKVYNQQLCDPTEEDRTVEPECTFEPEFEQLKSTPKPERRKKKKRKACKTFYDDPARDFLITTGGVALGYVIAEKLRLFKKPSTYVGNQDITDMSNERVKEYRRLGVLPPS